VHRFSAQILNVRYAANGDLFVYGAGHRWRYDSTGNIVDDIGVSSGTTLADLDGSWLYAKPMTESSEIDRYDSTGQLVWSRTYPYNVYVGDMRFAAPAEIVVHADIYARSPVLLTLDASSGDERHVNSGCVMSRLIGIDAEHCYGIGIDGLSQWRR
jgi:hypothetical protein